MTTIIKDEKRKNTVPCRHPIILFTKENNQRILRIAFSHKDKAEKKNLFV